MTTTATAAGGTTPAQTPITTPASSAASPPAGTPDPAPGAGTAPPAPAAPPPAPAGVPAGTPPAIDPDDAELGVTGDGEVVMMPRASFKRLKEKASARGQRRAADDLDEAARAAGFTGGARDAFAAIAKLATQPPTAPQPPPAPPAPAREERQAMARRLDDKERARRKKARTDHAAQLALKEQEIQRLKDQASARDRAAAEEIANADMRARLGALGMAEVEFGTHLVRSALAGKNPEQIKTWLADPENGLKKWVDDRKKDRPALFAPVVQAANTAPAAAGGSSVPGTPPVGTPPAPATPPPADVQGNALVHNMTRPRAEVDAELARLKARSREANR